MSDGSTIFGNHLTGAKESSMSLLRNIGNRLRRAEDGVADAPASSFAAKPMGERGGLMAAVDEAPDLYSEDRDLGHSIRGLEEVRAALKQLTLTANAHKERLIAQATTERLLGENLADMLRVRGQRGGEDGYDFSDDEDTILDRENEPLPAQRHFSRFLRTEDITATRVLGRGLGSHAESTVKLANAFSNPISDLQRAFEDRFMRKITPLRRRYVDQKGQYLKYKRHADIADNDEKRSYYEALAEAAKPVWLRTSTELKTESNVMTELTARNMAKWSRSLALQHERALAIAAANFADAFQRAKANNIPPRSAR